MKRSKRYQEAAKLIDSEKVYTVEEAVDCLQKLPKAKFDETVDISVKLGVDPRKSEQMVRGSAKMPHGTGKTIRVLVICEADKEADAKEAGADHVGGVELITKIADGWTDFDYCIATPSMMRHVSRLGKVLGPRGLMPSPKNGSVTDNLAYAVKDAKEGKVDFKMNKIGNLSAGVGKVSFEKSALAENVNEFLAALVKSKPAASKGKFLTSVFISSTMSPSLRLQLSKEMDI